MSEDLEVNFKSKGIKRYGGEVDRAKKRAKFQKDGLHRIVSTHTHTNSFVLLFV